MRVGLVGYGSVAAVHATQLKQCGDVRLCVVCGPDAAKASRFAATHAVESATTNLEEAAQMIDAAIVCSPSGAHYSQTISLLQAGVRVLVELPACGTAAEAQQIAEAGGAGGQVSCAHTSRYLQPYRKLRRWIAEGALGPIRHVHFIRHIPPRQRSWTDDALLHHGAHVLDLLLHWFGSVRPVACLAQPDGGTATQDLALLAVAGESTQVTMHVSYTSHLPQLTLTVAGERHSVITDGFSFVRSDHAEWEFHLDGNAEYERAIGEQDREFLNGRGIPWADTLRLAQLNQAFRDHQGAKQ